MKKTVLLLQVVFLVVFLSTFVASFFLIEHVKEQSREVVTNKVSEKLLGAISFVEELLNSKKVQTVLADHQIEVIQREISEFKEKPVAYIAQMTMQNTEVEVIPEELKTESKLKNALLSKVFGWKLKIKGYFQKTLDSLVFDIRLFLLTNVFGLLIAGLINVYQHRIGKHAFIGSLILTAVIAVSSFSYLNTNWLYSILLNSYAGIGYPIGVFSVSAWLFLEYYRTVIRTSE